MLHVVFHRLAAQEFRNARAWYAERSIDASIEFRQAVDIAVNRIVTSPESHAATSKSQRFRWVRVARFPYVLVFRRQSSDRIKVVAVAHTSRRPGYWRYRK